LPDAQRSIAAIYRRDTRSSRQTRVSGHNRSRAELNQTSSLISAASARFDYLRAMAAFQFAVGDVH
jgi:hypothetical protein